MALRYKRNPTQPNGKFERHISSDGNTRCLRFSRSHMKVIHVRTMKEDGRICTGGMIMGSVGMSDAVANRQLILI